MGTAPSWRWAITEPSSPPPEPEILRPYPAPSPVGRGALTQGPAGVGVLADLAGMRPSGKSVPSRKWGPTPLAEGCPGGLLPLDPHTAGPQPHSERRLAQDRRAKAWNIPPSPRGKVREGKSKAFLIVSGEGEGWNFSPRTPPQGHVNGRLPMWNGFKKGPCSCFAVGNGIFAKEGGLQMGVNRLHPGSLGSRLIHTNYTRTDRVFLSAM